MVKLMRGLVPKSVPNFTTSDHAVLGAAIDSHGRRRCMIIIIIIIIIIIRKNPLGGFAAWPPIMKKPLGEHRGKNTQANLLVKT